jgi:hypothetical protein
MSILVNAFKSKKKNTHLAYGLTCPLTRSVPSSRIVFIVRSCKNKCIAVSEQGRQYMQDTQFVLEPRATVFLLQNPLSYCKVLLVAASFYKVA